MEKLFHLEAGRKQKEPERKGVKMPSRLTPRDLLLPARSLLLKFLKKKKKKIAPPAGEPCP
jgi:hypothetical protein